MRSQTAWQHETSVLLPVLTVRFHRQCQHPVSFCSLSTDASNRSPPSNLKATFVHVARLRCPENTLALLPKLAHNTFAIFLGQCNSRRIAGVHTRVYMFVNSKLHSIVAFQLAFTWQNKLKNLGCDKQTASARTASARNNMGRKLKCSASRQLKLPRHSSWRGQPGQEMINWYKLQKGLLPWGKEMEDEHTDGESKQLSTDSPSLQELYFLLCELLHPNLFIKVFNFIWKSNLRLESLNGASSVLVYSKRSIWGFAAHLSCFKFHKRDTRGNFSLSPESKFSQIRFCLRSRAVVNSAAVSLSHQGRVMRLQRNNHDTEMGEPLSATSHFPALSSSSNLNACNLNFTIRGEISLEEFFHCGK